MVALPEVFRHFALYRLLAFGPLLMGFVPFRRLLSFEDRRDARRSGGTNLTRAE